MGLPQLVFDEEMNHINALVESARDWTMFIKRNIVWLISAAIVSALAGFYLAGQQTVSFRSVMSLTPFIDNVYVLEKANKDKLNEVLLAESILTGVLGSTQSHGRIRDQLQALTPDQALSELELLHQVRSYLSIHRAFDFSSARVTVNCPDLAFSTDLIRAFSAELTNQFINNTDFANVTISETLRSAIYAAAESLEASRARIDDFNASAVTGQLTTEQIEQKRRLVSDARIDSAYYDMLMTHFAGEKIDELRNPAPHLNDLIKGDIRYTEIKTSRNKTFLVALLIGMTLTVLILRARDLIRGSQAAAKSA